MALNIIPTLATVDWKNATAQYALSGGGNVTYSASGLAWTARVIAIPVENSEFAVGGYVDINCPTSGTVTYYNAAGATTTLTCTAAGIPISSWEALYYQVTEGQASTSDQTKFRVVNYQNTTWSPTTGWILIAAVNGDTPLTAKWLPGEVAIPLGGTYYSTTGTSSWQDAATLTTAIAMSVTFGY
jgi:hypothetical protein